MQCAGFPSITRYRWVAFPPSYHSFQWHLWWVQVPWRRLFFSMIKCAKSITVFSKGLRGKNEMLKISILGSTFLPHPVTSVLALLFPIRISEDILDPLLLNVNILKWQRYCLLCWMDDGISTSREISTGKKRSYIGLRVGNVSNPSDRTFQRAAMG